MATRVDSWTWAVRLYRSRTLAAAACRAGHVKVNNRAVKPAFVLSVGDRIEARTAPDQVRIVEVQALIAKRVGAEEARRCYVDHTPARPPRQLLPVVARRERGAGRPTKRERRALDTLKRRPPQDL